MNHKNTTTNLFFPVILNKGKENPPNPCGMNDTASQLAEILVDADWQQRKSMSCHLLLVLAAQNKADDMAKRDYLSHNTPGGITPNENVVMTGYKLPDWYFPVGNNVESWHFGSETAEKAIENLLTSPTHRRHIAGESDFTRSQECFGVGVSQKDPTDPYTRIYVIVTAHCPVE